jgi:hypothetical protein
MAGSSRVRTLFRLVQRVAARGGYSWLLRIPVRFCKLADRAHRERWRLFAHTENPKVGVYTVCFSRAAERELTDEEILGMSAHELGHVVGGMDRWPEHSKPQRGPETPQAVQDEADRIAREVLGFRNLRYNRRSLQELRPF